MNTDGWTLLGLPGAGLHDGADALLFFILTAPDVAGSTRRTRLAPIAALAAVISLKSSAMTQGHLIDTCRIARLFGQLARANFKGATPLWLACLSICLSCTAWAGETLNGCSLAIRST
jgi:hypothetical protein